MQNVCLMSIVFVFFLGGHKIILECDNSCITLENTKSHLDYTLQYCESYVNFTSIK